MREYDLIADWYASERVGSGEGSGVPEVMALASSVAAGGCALDVGCGNGLPLTRALLGAGLRVVGLESSRKMLGRFQDNCPAAQAVHGAVQACPFARDVFDAAIAWGVMFHLKAAEQMRAIAQVSRVLRIGAPFLFTSGDADDDSGDHIGTMNSVEFRYYSLSVEGYRHALGAHGLELTELHHDRGGNLYYLARKTA